MEIHRDADMEVRPAKIRVAIRADDSNLVYLLLDACCLYREPVVGEFPVKGWIFR